MKRNNRILTIILALSLLPIVGLAQETLKADKANSEVTITGTSTLHDWEINVNEFSGMVEGQFQEKKPEISDGKMSFQVASFESGKNAMDKNVYEALKEEDHPEITFELKNTKLPHAATDNYDISVVGDLTIAGHTEEIEVSMTGQLKENQLKVEGSKSFKMSKFKVDPPTVMFGTIKTGDKVTVQFSIIYN
ncbi:MAG: YceI family protein [Bacteroidales bacterium]|nr:YceI family protein [Bacteroidales bacterium]MCF8334121.1 YceI family protein [Bacteroidales bacterium]